MRMVVQRVKRAAVSVDGQEVSRIGPGVCVLLGVGAGDSEPDADWLADKLVNLRIFEDEEEKMNLSLLDVKGAALLVSQFTLYGDCRKGRRPSFAGAAGANEGRRLYEYFVERVRASGVEVGCGVFQAHMEVEILNDGPITLIVDTEGRAATPRIGESRNHP
ncbi:MAG: D-tyrosyl-tRNA(Tyr) deacylase [Synergistaceae bacterium]|nr:D-tyrosyl-tRNA(Tyr) deacylase [Synergistaceae bacterium]